MASWELSETLNLLRRWESTKTDVVLVFAAGTGAFGKLLGADWHIKGKFISFSTQDLSMTINLDNRIFEYQQSGGLIPDEIRQPQDPPVSEMLEIKTPSDSFRVLLFAVKDDPPI